MMHLKLNIEAKIKKIFSDKVKVYFSDIISFSVFIS